MKIQKKILIIILSLIILVGISTILVSRHIATNIIKQQITDNLLNTTQSRAEHIKTFLDLEKAAIKQLSESIVIEELLLSKKEEESYFQKYDKVLTRLKYTAQIGEYTYDIFILDKEGIIIASSDEKDIGKDKNNDPYFLEGKEGVFIKDVYISSYKQRKTLAFSAPIFNEKDITFLGVVVIRVSPEVLYDVATDYTGLGQTGEIYLVNKDGYMISPSRFIDDVILKQKIDLKHIKECKDTETPFVLLRKMVNITTDYRDIKVLTAHTHIPEMGWSLVAEMDVQEAFTPVTQLTDILILAFIIILIISIFISGFTSRTITRPIKKLYTGTNEITKGNLDYKVGTPSLDEVGQLSRAFDEMTSNLKKTREELLEHSRNLEKKVEEKTRDLKLDINERKKVEGKLREEKVFSDTLIDTAQAIVLLLDKKGSIIHFNHFMEEISGYKLEEVKGKSWLDTFLPERNRVKIQKLFLKAIGGMQTKGYINSIVTKDGREMEIEWYDKIIIDKNKKIIGLLTIGLDITERKELQKALRRSEERLSFALNATNDGVWDRDLKTDKLYLSDQYYKILGYVPGETTITSKGFRDLLHPEDKEGVLRKIEKCIEGKTKNYHAEFRLKTKSGKWKWILGRGKVVSHDSSGKALRFLGTHVDISLRRQMEETLRGSMEKFANLFQNNPEAAVYTDEKGDILDINFRFTKLFGYTLDEIKGKNISSGIIHSPSKLKEGEELTRKVSKGSYYGFETVRKKKDGTIFPVYISGSLIFIYGKNKGMINQYQDITERKKLEEKLEKLARIDSLTGAYNRGYALELLDRQIKLSRRNNSPLLLAFLDIDRFKSINDNFGHDEGDKVLKEVTKLFKSTLREIDIICRIGGDEFLLIFPDNSLKKVALIRSRLEEKLLMLNKTIKKNYQVKFSMGFSEYLSDKPKTLDELINIADQRMYKEKNLNK